MHLWRSILAVTAMMMGVSALRADIIIDDFSVPNPGTTYTLATPAGSTFGQTDALANSTRSLLVTQTVNLSGLANATVGFLGNVTGFGPSFSMSTTAGTRSNSVLTYTFNTPVDLVAAGATDIRFTLTRADLDVPYSISVTGTSSTATVNGTLPSVTSTTTGISNPLSSFSAAGLSGVTSVSFSLNAGPNSVSDADLVVNDFAFVVPPPPQTIVPAPPAVFLMLAAVPALGFRRVRAKLGLA